jgi:predicted CxxxxCH...CXXCH cytochrome family protein
MKMNIKIYGLLAMLTAALFIIHGCAQLEDNITVPQTDSQCSLCHGSGDHANPPKALNGDITATSLGVGAHETHLYLAANSSFVACSECHKPVTNVHDSTHIDGDNIAEVKFGPLAKNTLGGGVTANPVWNRTTATCSNSYCHGQFKGGRLNNSVSWTSPGSVVCGSCHGDPVTGNPNPGNPPHSVSNWTRTDCAMCHFSVIDSTGTITNPEKHVNGIVNFAEQP